MTVSLPDKPPFGTACNGCGVCCKLSLCPVGAMAFPGAVGPCPALKIAPNGTRTYCELVAIEIVNGMQPIIQTVLGAGYGCSMVDDDTTDQQITEHQAKWDAMAKRQRRVASQSPQPLSP